MEAASAVPVNIDPYELQTGGFGIRFLGRLIDWIVGMVLGLFAGLIGGIIGAILAAAGVVDGDWLQRMQAVNFFGNLVWGLIAGLLYHTVAEGIGGATIGKLLIGHRVVDANLRPAGALAAFKRSLAYFVDSFFFGMPAYSSMSDSSLQQRIGDKWASTVVAKANALPAHAKRSGGLIALGIFAGSTAYVACLAISMVARAL